MQTVQTVKQPLLMKQVETMLQQGRKVRLKAKGNSMLPFIRHNRDSVELSATAEFRKGDILLCRLSPEYYVLHRLIRVKGDLLTLMGDGNIRETEYCSIDQVLGKVEKIIRDDAKEINCYSPVERMKAKIWFYLLPIRKYLLSLIRKINKL